MRTLAITLLLAAAAGAQGWQDLAGAPCPEFGAARWLNTDRAPTLRALKGQVFLLVFFGGT